MSFLQHGKIYGPIDLSARYRYRTENFMEGTGQFIWLPRLRSLALISSEQRECGEPCAVTPGVADEIFPAVMLEGRLYLLDVRTPAHLDNPAFVLLEILQDEGESARPEAGE